MRRTKENTAEAIRSGWQLRFYAVIAMLLLAAVEAVGQDRAQIANATVEDPAVEPTREIIVSLPDRKLAVVEDGKVVKTFPVAIGKASTPSPVGDFTIKNRVLNPSYYHKGKVIPAGDWSPIGNRWIGLSVKGYGIHGTNEPRSIGKAASHGCIRMAKADVEELFEMVRPGDLVSIRAERDSQVAQIFGGQPSVMILAAHHPQSEPLGGGQ